MLTRKGLALQVEGWRNFAYKYAPGGRGEEGSLVGFGGCWLCSRMDYDLHSYVGSDGLAGGRMT